jgi:hypothetical protein
VIGVVADLTVLAAPSVLATVAAAPADLDQPLACSGAACPERERAWRAMQNAAAWMARFPDGELRFDAAIMLSQIQTSVDGEMLRRAAALARANADRDADHPHRRFYDPAFRSPREHTATWTAPPPGGSRVNPNLVVSEALHCAENGWRPEATAYACGAMRDHGGYHSVHALWALLLARDQGCVDLTATAPCLRSLEEELTAAQPAELAPARTLDVDLYAERLLMLVKSGARGPAIDASVAALLAHQDSDGSFGVRVPGEQPYHRFHATAIATWALAEWQRRSAGAMPASPTPLASPAAGG